MENRKIRVLVTGVGAIIGYGVIQSLRISKYDCFIVGMDIYEDAVGQAWCDEFVQAKPAADPDYVAFLLQVMHRYEIDLVFFGTEQEIRRLSGAREEIGEEGRKLVLNRKEIIDLSDDKWATICLLRENGMEAIPSMIEDDYSEIVSKLGSPFLLKPRCSYAGKGMAIIRDEKEFDFLRCRMKREQFMVQKIIGDNDHEYTAATFGFGDGTSFTTPIIFARTLSQEGATSKAFSVEIPEIVTHIHQLVSILHPIGPTNFQFRKEGDSFYLLEINPRISSSTSIRAGFGYNEAEMCVDWYYFGIRPEQPHFRSGVARRYIADWIDVK